MEDIKFNEIYIKDEFAIDNSSDVQSLQTELDIKEEISSENYQDNVNFVQNDCIFLENKYEIGPNIGKHHTSSGIVEHRSTYQPNHNQLSPSSSTVVRSLIQQYPLILPKPKPVNQQQAPSVAAQYMVVRQTNQHQQASLLFPLLSAGESRPLQNQQPVLITSCDNCALNEPNSAKAELDIENAILSYQLNARALLKGGESRSVQIQQPVLNSVLNEPSSDNAELDIENAIPSYQLNVGALLNGQQNAVHKLEIINGIKYVKDLPEPESKIVYICEESGCEKSFEEEYNLGVHRWTHTHEKPHKCDNCNQVFKIRSNMIRHQEQHLCEKAKKQKTCDDCNKEFATKSSLKKHKIRFHFDSDRKTYICEICNKGFSEQSNLYRHKYTHKDKSRYQCDQCERSFNQKFYLTDHKMIHSGERKYVCEICDKSFIGRHNYQRHKALHSDVCSYVCKVCNKGFKTSVLKYQHMFVHSDKNPNVCKVCDMAFMSKRELTKHCRLSHKEK